MEEKNYGSSNYCFSFSFSFSFSLGVFQHSIGFPFLMLTIIYNIFGIKNFLKKTRKEDVSLS